MKRFFSALIIPILLTLASGIMNAAANETAILYAKDLAVQALTDSANRTENSTFIRTSPHQSTITPKKQRFSDSST